MEVLREFSIPGDHFDEDGIFLGNFKNGTAVVINVVDEGVIPYFFTDYEDIRIENYKFNSVKKSEMFANIAKHYAKEIGFNASTLHGGNFSVGLVIYEGGLPVQIKMSYNSPFPSKYTTNDLATPFATTRKKTNQICLYLNSLTPYSNKFDFVSTIYHETEHLINGPLSMSNEEHDLEECRVYNLQKQHESYGKTKLYKKLVDKQIIKFCK